MDVSTEGRELRRHHVGSPARQRREREHYGHLASNCRSAKPLEKIYVDKVGPKKEADLVQFVRDVERVISGDVHVSADRVVFEGLATLGKDVVLKYLMGLKIAVLLPTLEAGATDRWEEVDIVENDTCLRRLKLLIGKVRFRAATVH